MQMMTMKLDIERDYPLPVGIAAVFQSFEEKIPVELIRQIVCDADVCTRSYTLSTFVSVSRN